MWIKIRIISCAYFFKLLTPTILMFLFIALFFIQVFFIIRFVRYYVLKTFKTILTKLLSDYRAWMFKSAGLNDHLNTVTII